MRLLSRLFDRSREISALSNQVEHLEARLELATRAGSGPTASGVEQTWGEFEYEHNANLRGDSRWAEFDKMETDPRIKAALRAQVLPLINADWEMKPYSDDPRDKEIAEFCAANLLRQSSDKFGRDYWIQTPWRAQRLPEILDFLRVGFSVFVASWRQVGSNWVYDRLQWLEPSTISGTRPWDLSSVDFIKGISRDYEDPETEMFKVDEYVPAERLKLYTYEMKGARYEGRAFIRSMYGAYIRKEFIQRQAAIWAQKVGAPVPFGQYPKGWNSAYINEFERFIKGLRGSASAEHFGMFPMGQDGTMAEVKYAGSETGEVDRMSGLVDSENAEIASAGGIKSDLLGETQSGSRALAEPQQGREMLHVESTAKVLSEWEAHGVGNLMGVIEELVDRNYSDVAGMPELVCSKISGAGVENFEQIVESWKAGIIPKHADARRQMVEQLGLELPEDAFEMDDMMPMVPGMGGPPGQPGGPQSPGSPPNEPDPDRVAAASSSAFEKRLAKLLEPVEGGPRPGGGRFRKQAGD